MLSLTETRNTQEQKVITPSSVTNLENLCRTGDMATFLDVSGSSPIAYIGLGELYRYISCEGPPEPVTEYVEIDVAWSFFSYGPQVDLISKGEITTFED